MPRVEPRFFYFIVLLSKNLCVTLLIIRSGLVGKLWIASRRSVIIDLTGYVFLTRLGTKLTTCIGKFHMNEVVGRKIILLLTWLGKLNNYGSWTDSDLMMPPGYLVLPVPRNWRIWRAPQLSFLIALIDTIEKRIVSASLNKWIQV